MSSGSGSSDRRRVYLDYNATAPIRPEVKEAVEPLLFGSVSEGHFGNASSIHWAGQQAKRALESARQTVSGHTGRKPSEIVFTSGGTEADNLALRGVLAAAPGHKRRLVISAVEHPAIARAARDLESEGVEVTRIGVDAEGRLDLERLESALARPTALVSVMAVNNETGVLLPISDVLAIARAKDVPVHVDAVQAAGRIALPIEADLLTLSAHKLGGLKGAGALILRESLPFVPQIVGGAQERGRRAGTESVGAIVSLAVALDLAERERVERVVQWKTLRDRLEARVAAIEGATILGAKTDRVAQTTTVLFDGIEGDALLQALDLEGIAASSGSACSSGSLEPSPVLLAMGLAPERALAAVRFSFGWATQEEELERLWGLLPGLVRQVRDV